uniref:C2H2-type domain-containing protein n=1 Tax=Steinernema glaseri TaxID=37863 RepID=A0A1I7YAE6_9BILA
MLTPRKHAKIEEENGARPMLRQLLLSPTTEEAMSPAAVHMHQQPPPTAVDTHQQLPGYYAPDYEASSFNSVSSDGINTQQIPPPPQQQNLPAYHQQPPDYPVKVDNGEYAVLSTIPQEQQFQYPYHPAPPPYGHQSMTGLPEMFSSTYAVLSGDPNVPDSNWNYYDQGYPQSDSGGFYPQPQSDYQNWSGQAVWCGQMQQENATPGDPYLDYSNDSGISSTVNDNSPPPNETLPEVERVLCIACKGVYPSKRSLTGHIGRNDVCRESIIQKCLEQPPGGTIQTAEDLIGKFTSICPFCDKFISNFKINIRRHLLLCSKSPHEAGVPSQPLSAPRRPSSKVKGVSGSPASTGPESPSFELPAQPPPKKTSNTNNADDPYICSFCAFVTVYKGNMKRHLGSCHQMNDEAIRQAGGLDSMRASARDPTMPVPAPTSARSFRGRKPKN